MIINQLVLALATYSINLAKEKDIKADCPSFDPVSQICIPLGS